MTQRNIHSQNTNAMSIDMRADLPLLIGAALILVVVLITVLTGAGIGFA